MNKKQIAAEFRTAARALQAWVRQNGVIQSQDMAKQKELASLLRAVDGRALSLGIVCPEIKRRPDDFEGTPIGNCGLVHRPGRTTTALPDNCSDARILDGGAQWNKAVDSMVFVADQIAATDNEPTESLPFSLQRCDVEQTLKRSGAKAVTISNPDYWKLMEALMAAYPNAIAEPRLKHLFQHGGRDNATRRLNDIIDGLHLKCQKWTLQELEE